MSFLYKKKINYFFYKNKNKNIIKKGKAVLTNPGT